MEETQGSVRWSRRTPKTATYEKRRANRRAIEKLERVPTAGKEAKGAEPLLSLDVMHITKNMCESLLGTLLNIPEKTKDGPKARYDLQSIGIREELHAGRPNDDDDDDDDDDEAEDTQSRRKGKNAKKIEYYCPACVLHSKSEGDRAVFRLSPRSKTSLRYAGKISRYLDKAKQRFSGMKSHDRHVPMTQILPGRDRGDTCELEMYFPPAFFTLWCILVHIVEDIIQLGPTFLHSMMPFERMNGVIKGYVRNRARPDGSIAKGFLTEECISFCTSYLEIENPVGLPVNRHLGKLAGWGHRDGSREMHVDFKGRITDFERANLVALQHIDVVDPWVVEHKIFTAKTYSDQGQQRTDGDIIKEHNSTFTRWFKDKMLTYPIDEDSSVEEKLIFALSQGAEHNLMTFQAYDINDYTFYTEEKDMKSDYQNSGVTMESYTGDVKQRYYGKIEEIWELSYAGENVPMFRVVWAKNVIKEDRHFTTMVIPKPNPRQRAQSILVIFFPRPNPSSSSPYPSSGPPLRSDATLPGGRHLPPGAAPPRPALALPSTPIPLLPPCLAPPRFNTGDRLSHLICDLVLDLAVEEQHLVCDLVPDLAAEEQHATRASWSSS
ncbi:hypothetical protein QYE76_040527 [Lolium multiflorum]|uniref:DUF4218 domain-containing protein n=1 Tax=Lolium multiflorum TaxID=4521 RepID=A0AAD8TD76_LOLMU|nr:hypothetical protein QYE76_040527 [Lolium multiflorum]